MTMKKKIIAIIIAAVLLIAIGGTVTVCCLPKKDNPDVPDDSGKTDTPDEPDTPDVPSGGGEDNDGYLNEIFNAGVYNPTKVWYSAEYLGKVERRLPEASNGGLDRYPAYGTTLSDTTDEEKQAILNENAALCASTSTYDAMDKDGNLYLGGVATGNKLYKHTASDGLYEGSLSDDEEAVVKKITMQARPAGNHITGLYAPAGEVVKIEMSAEDLEKTGGLIVRIGQALQNGQANNIWIKRDFVRMPNLLNTMAASSEVTYVGSFLGGPIYVQPVNAGVKFSVTVSGAVPYWHYIYGYTTEEEFYATKNSSTPYFDMEIWDDAVRHSGPKARAVQFDYEQITAAAVLWDKISRVSNQVPSGSAAAIGITFLYDPFVAAGSMVAFVGRSTVNCPLYCMTAALDAESAVNNSTDAFWGCIHEYNHHYQRYGFSGGDEVTNNAVSLVSYSLFTRNSANREIGNANEGNYAVGWDRYTNPSWALRQTLANSSTNSNLDSYANLLHSFGQSLFLQAAKNGNGAGGVDNWYKAVSDATRYDMTYYFTEILHQTVSDSVVEEYASKGYPAFVPVATIYQTGRSYVIGGNKYYSRTAQPYGIEKGNDFQLNFNDNIVIPSGFSWSVKSVTEPEYGELYKVTDGVYTYTPDENAAESGKIIITLAITKDGGAFLVDDVDLVIELRQKQYKPTLLERTVYTYTNETMYASPVEAYEKGYAGYETVTDGDNDNPTQNANTDIWVPDPKKNAIMEVRGKFYVPSKGKYRIAIRGRQYAALYLSFDGQNYELAANMTNLTNNVAFLTDNENNYKDYELEKGQWVYFKEILLVTYDRSFVGLGWGRFDGDKVNVTYLKAYRNSYYREEFVSDYYYDRNYTYSYNEKIDSKQTLIETNYKPWDASKSIDILFDDDDTNWIHSDQSNISEETPFELTAALEETVKANKFVIYGEPSRKYQPKNFKLYVGTELENMKLVAEVTDSVRNNDNVTVNFEETDVRYYKLVLTDTWATSQRFRYISFRCVKFFYSIENGTVFSPDEKIFNYKGNWTLSDKFSTFGHLYDGENATLNFSFRGERFAVFSYISDEYDGFEVLIDGEVADTVKINGGSNEPALAYLSEKLSDGEHKITIRSKTKFNVDSIVLWQK